jgi:hypothetical protein
MGKVAIVGVEGSGKTVLMASLAECYGSISGDEPYLMPENQAAYLFMKQVPHRLRVDRQWPGATGIDALRTMKWTLRLGQQVLQKIEMLDYPGELYRIAFGERSAEEVAAHRAELDEFLIHLTDADTLIVLFNLADGDNQGASERNAETVWITRGIFDFAEKLSSLKRQFLVFTQADRYATALEEAGGAEGLFAQKLPMLKVLHPNLPVMAVSAVGGMDGEGRPLTGYSAQGCRDVMRAILAEQDQEARESLWKSGNALERVIDFNGRCFNDFKARLGEFQAELAWLKTKALPVKSFYREEIEQGEAHAEYWGNFQVEALALDAQCSLEQLAQAETWAGLRSKYPNAGRILQAFQSKCRVDLLQKIKEAEAEAERRRKEDLAKGWKMFVIFNVLVAIVVFLLKMFS